MVNISNKILNVDKIVMQYVELGEKHILFFSFVFSPL